MIKEYWQKPAHSLFFDGAFAEIKSVFSQEKKVYYELSRLMPKVFLYDENNIKNSVKVRLSPSKKTFFLFASMKTL